MRWFKRTTTSSKEPSTKQPDPDVQERPNIIALSEVNAKEVVEQMMRFLMPVYEHVVDSDKARFLLAYTKMRYPLSVFLPRFTSYFEAALALLDDRVSVLRYFCKNPEEKFIINDIEQYEKKHTLELRRTDVLHSRRSRSRSRRRRRRRS